MGTQLDDMETVGTEGSVGGETPQPTGDLTVASGVDREVSAIDEANNAPEDERVVQAQVIPEGGDDGVTQEDSEARLCPPPVPELPEEILDSETPKSADTTNSQQEKQSKGKEPQYTEPIEPVPESPAGPSNTTPSSRFPKPRAVYSQPAYGSHVPWELDAERPAQKLPILFKDAVGRKFLIPWRRAKTWEGMKMTIDSAFEKIDGPLGVHVPAGHYDLSFAAASSLSEEPTNSHEAAVQPEPAGSPGVTFPRLNPVIVLPDFWEDLIQPGMSVSMSMWPIGVCPPMNPRGQWPNGVPGGGRGMPGQGFGGPNVTTVPPPPPHFMNVVNVGPPMGRRGKTRVNPGRPVRK